MVYYYDDFGWLSQTPVEGRSTTVAPPTESLADGWAWNYVGIAGREWEAMELNPALIEPIAPLLPESYWWIDTGPFKDRLGMDALAIGASTHDACKGVMAMLEGRKYVDLKEVKTSAMLDILIATGQPAANPIFPGSGPMTGAKKATILNTPTTEKERHLKGV